MASTLYATMLKGAKLTVTVANGTKVLHDDVIGLGRTFTLGGEP